MRKNILLHFINRDAREVFGIQQLPSAHRDELLNRALNAAIILCEECCVMPPGFLLECEVAFDLSKEQRTLPRQRLYRTRAARKLFGIP